MLKHNMMTTNVLCLFYLVFITVANVLSAPLQTELSRVYNEIRIVLNQDTSAPTQRHAIHEDWPTFPKYSDGKITYEVPLHLRLKRATDWPHFEDGGNKGTKNPTTVTMTPSTMPPSTQKVTMAPTTAKPTTSTAKPAQLPEIIKKPLFPLMPWCKLLTKGRLGQNPKFGWGFFGRIINHSMCGSK